MSPLTFGNLAAWSIQAALIVGAGLTTLWLVQLEAPAVRYLFLRALLAICLTLPLVQPRTTVEVALERGTTGGVAIAVTSGQARGPANAVAAHALPWPSAIGAVILVGALARLVWIAAGIVKLRRLRRAGAVAEASADHEDLQRVIAARATIRYVRDLAQPVTFGFLAPVILLPSAVRDQPASIQRAVLAHELWHVRRRDWLWTLCEEGLRAAVWFHPAVWSLLSRIQSAREEVVDELTVLTTGSRRTYVDALLAFADSSPSMAAPAFARRKHLVRRLGLISKEAVMSGRRVVASGAALGAVVLITSWYSVQAFPMRGAQQLPSDAAAAVPGPLERQAKPITPENPIPRRTYNVPAAEPAGFEDAGAGGTVTLRVTLDVSGHVAEVRAVRVMYRQKDSLTVNVSDPSRENLERMAQGAYRGSSSDRSISMQKAAQNVEAMIGSATQAVRQWQYAPPADGPISFNVPVHFGPPPPPPPPPPPAGEPGVSRRNAPPPPPPPPPRTSSRPGPMPEAPPPPPPPPPDWARQDASDPPLRVGGTIKPPTKLKNVNPVYPQEAQDAKVQGVVIIEARIERDGTVGRARVLRSIPMLDDAAVDAVRQWEFTPTLLNGAPMPVMMTVTVNFTLQ
jgi:TonB family protein